MNACRKETIMPQVIANTYEVIREIGSGGGGIVYLGRHRRLNKLIVIKEDKRLQDERLRSRLTEEALRREVDALKNLSHTYIPQVYDYVEENGSVYTVMDYIEGESLDKPLQRGEQFPQKQVVEWACELLEALCYLHSRPPHGILHSDIKPANVMVTPQGDIRLIDYNIALALGEEGAVRVGRSMGYASPEHFGQDYSEGESRTHTGGGTRSDSVAAGVRPGSGTAAALQKDGKGHNGTELVDGSQGSSSHAQQSKSATPQQSVTPYSSNKTVLLDVRSDVYSMGATLYHLLTGERPAQKIEDIKPISSFRNRNISPAVVEIITKAMNPNPNKRYQTAAEMLYAFEHLHERDTRTRRRRRHIALTAVLVAVIALAGGVISYVGLRQSERLKDAYVQAGYSVESLRNGNVSAAVSYAMQALPQERGLLDPPYIPQAQRALANALGVYDLSDSYQPYCLIQLEDDAKTGAKPSKICLSPDGTKSAVLLNTQGAWNICVYDVESGILVAELPAERSVFSDFIFIDNENILYAGEGALKRFNLANHKMVWSADYTVTGLALSYDGKVAAGVNRDEQRAVIFDASTGEQIQTVDFNGKHLWFMENDVLEDRNHSLFSLDSTGRRLAVSFSDGGLWVFDLENRQMDAELLEESEYQYFEGGFQGPYFVVSAYGGGDSVLAAFQMDEMEQTIGYTESVPFHVQADETGVYVSLRRVVSCINPESGEETEAAFTGEDNVSSFLHKGQQTVVLTESSQILFFDENASLRGQYDSENRVDFLDIAQGYFLAANRDAPSFVIRKRISHTDAQIFSYDPSYTHLEARVHSDGETVMLFSATDFRVLDKNGVILCSIDFPDAGQMYDQQYRRGDASDYLEIIYNDGRRRTFSAKTGDMLTDEQGPVPDRTAYYEEFETADFLVASDLHGTPVAYRRDSGVKIRELEPEGDLTYVTQIGDALITEYNMGDAQRYGLLLNDQCEPLADLPNLCDILSDGTLIFDDTYGSIRKGRIYSVEELIQLGESYLLAT